MSALGDYIDAELERHARSIPGGRWLYDCPWCGERWELHDDGRCTRTDYPEPKGIETGGHMGTPSSP